MRRVPKNETLIQPASDCETPSLACILEKLQIDVAMMVLLSMIFFVLVEKWISAICTMFRKRRPPPPGADVDEGSDGPLDMREGRWAEGSDDESVARFKV